MFSSNRILIIVIFVHCATNIFINFYVTVFYVLKI